MAKQLESYTTYAEWENFHAQTEKKIAIGLLGGTLLSGNDPVKGRHPVVSGTELLRKNPKLRLVKHRIRKLDIITIMGKDSSDMVDEDWTAATQAVAHLSPHYHGILLVIGTDTPFRVGTAINFGLKGLARLRGLPGFFTTPVALGSSQQILGEFQSDAELQMEDSLATLIKASDRRVSEAMIPTGHDRVLRANRSVKITEDGFDIHDSPNYPAIGRIRASENPRDLEGIQFTRYAQLIPNTADFYHFSTQDLVQPYFRGGIESIALNGLGAVTTRLATVEHPDCTGLVIYTHGAGNGPFTNPKRTIVPVVERATELGKPVLLTTSIYGGKVNPTIYEAGRVLEQAGGIATSDMTPAAAEVKLAWAMMLPEFSDRGISFIKDVFNKDLVGEMGDPDLATS